MSPPPESPDVPDDGSWQFFDIARGDAILTNLLKERQRQRQRWAPRLQLVLRLVRNLHPEHDAVPGLLRLTQSLLAAVGLPVCCPDCQQTARLEYEAGTATDQTDPGSLVFRHQDGTCRHDLRTRTPVITVIGTGDTATGLARNPQPDPAP